jgi:hypothetical protein
MSYNFFHDLFHNIKNVTCMSLCMHYTRDNEMMKKMSYFVEIKFHLNENIP